MLLPYSLNESEAAFKRGLQISRKLSYHKGVADFACYVLPLAHRTTVSVSDERFCNWQLAISDSD